MFVSRCCDIIQLLIRNFYGFFKYNFLFVFMSSSLVAKTNTGGPCLVPCRFQVHYLEQVELFLASLFKLFLPSVTPN